MLIPGSILPANVVEVMNTLIKTVILNNSHVMKFNAFHRMHRSDPGEASAISDDEEESAVPTLGTFMDIQSALMWLASDNPSPGLPPPAWVPDQGPMPVDAVLAPGNLDLDPSAPGIPGW